MLEKLAPNERDWAPAQLFPNTALYHARADNAVRGHLSMMRRSEDDPDRLYDTQTLWDNAMGDSCARALEEHPGSSVLHVNGSFHSSFWDGTCRQLLLRKPCARVRTVSIVPALAPSSARWRGAPVADYVIFAEARATDLNEGTWSVHVGREVDYRFHLPASAEDSTEDSTPVPLLIWLPDDGLSAADGMALWKDRLGDEVALAVLDAPYRETQEDLTEGGRWYWPDSFASDVGAMQTAIERVWGYALRHWPIDPDRVCVAGEGTGATLATIVTVLSPRLSARSLAFAPRRFAKIKDLPLPLPADRGVDLMPSEPLEVFTEAADRAWWEEELAEYRRVGLDATLRASTDDPWRLELERENALRAALSVDARDPGRGSETDRLYVQLESQSPRERLWARLEALRREASNGQAVAVLDAPPAVGSARRLRLAADPDSELRIPRCPGPFGGTTVLVVGADETSERRSAWLELERSDPLAAESRFHRLRVAATGSETDLPSVLSDLSVAGRKNVLIAPAEFCATPETLRALARSVRSHADRMNLHWTPGLGAPQQ